jgi:hypothetical protein
MGVHELGRWVPARPEDLTVMFAGADFPWWITGGYAIELAVGRQLRPHGDLDVLVLAAARRLAREVLSDWDIRQCPLPKLRQWLITAGPGSSGGR